ncbi:hypothetical protein ACFPOI_17225 [Nonomuraea angiospora]|uniref:Uncharacterized protein n=1 Tax=Nonomuraea angiospora TaxID=46172 RepID=A0ABR9MHK3_9ACTN|nr:hypothetical protein [Nonomuraea angiospora]MBE1592388.1 hypothetical protein [Nonomuraea angiospora]
MITELVAHPCLERVTDAESAAKAVAGLTGYATGDVPLLVRRSGAEAVALVTGAFPNASAYPLRDAPQGMWADHDFDPGRYAPVSTVRVNAVVAEAEVWNPATGTRQAAAITVKGQQSTIKVLLDGAPAAIVVWREGEAPLTAPEAPSPATVETDLSSGWYGRLVPTMDNTWGDLAPPAATPVDQLQIWSFTWQNGDAEQAARATYGNRVRVLGPVPTERAPAALDRDAVGRILAGEWPLVDDDAGWGVSLYSSSRGAADPGPGTLGHKGLVNEEFIRVGRPETGTISRVRAVVETDRLGAAELIVGAAAGKRLWWNGVELPTGNGYLASARIDIDQRLNVIEYELSDAEIHVGLGTPAETDALGSFFCLTRPGEFSPRPQFMRLPPAVRPDGQVTYRARVHLRQDATEGVLIVGAATGVTAFLDGAVVARQERVEYYGSAWAATPDYFRHDLSLEAGEHLLEIVADSTQAGDVVYVDLVARTNSSVVTLVSGSGWEAETGGWRGRSIEHRGRWAELQPCHAAVRPHPLHGTPWLHGAPALGTTVDAIHVTDDITPAPQQLRTILPAGAISVHLPLRLGARVLLDCVEQRLDGTTLDLGRPLQAPTALEIVTEPTVVLRGGGVLSGPVTVRTEKVPVPLGNWHAMGLAGWSGGMRYSRTVSVPSGSDSAGVPVLDLGRVRGTVEVAVDGEKAGEAFCGPYRFALPGTAGRTVRIDITVYNTLAPFLHESTPTAWTFPSQLASGLLGPVTLLTPQAVLADS